MALKTSVSGIFLIFLTGCVSTVGVISKGNYYSLHVSNGNAFEVKSKAYRIAGQFCADQERVIRTIKESLKTEDVSPSKLAIELDFECVPKPGAMSAKPPKE